MSLEADKFLKVMGRSLDSDRTSLLCGVTAIKTWTSSPPFPLTQCLQRARPLIREGGQASGEEGGESQNAPELPNLQSSRI
eukprot:476588-Amorphochlora_amoeboformis.AAC.1